MQIIELDGFDASRYDFRNVNDRCARFAKMVDTLAKDLAADTWETVEVQDRQGRTLATFTR